jgi:hypothetical protein
MCQVQIITSVEVVVRCYIINSMRQIYSKTEKLTREETIQGKNHRTKE